MHNITSATFARHGGKFFFEFSFHAEMIGNGKGPSLQKRLFIDRASFEAHLHSWNRDGWRYFQTAEDIEVNSEAAVVLAYPSPVWRTETETARTGRYAHNYEPVLRSDVADRLAKALGLAVHEVGTFDSCAALGLAG